MRPVAVVLLFALVACGGGGTEQALARVPSAPASTASTTISSATAPATTTTTTTDPRADGRRRVLMVGDSMTFGAIPALDAVMGVQGVETRYVGFSATGLLSGQGWWNREITAQVEAWQPDVVVIEACCNYANGEPEFVDDEGQAVAVDSEEMYEEWAAMAADAVVRASAGGAAVFWVVTPCALVWGENPIPARIERFNAISAGLGVERIDWAAELCPDGEFSSTAEIDGEVVQVRADDGLHLNDAGDEVVAGLTWQAIADRIEGS